MNEGAWNTSGCIKHIRYFQAHVRYGAWDILRCTGHKGWIEEYQSACSEIGCKGYLKDTWAHRVHCTSSTFVGMNGFMEYSRCRTLCA